MSKKQDTFFIIVIVLMLLGTAVINKAQAASHNGKSKQASKAERIKKATQRSYTIKGVRYRPIDNARNFVQTGKASWYGPGFHGRKTSNGERYNMNALTAAHPTLPLSTYVRVTNLGNKKSVIVRINDRGPFHGKRVIDLSKAAAGRLGFVKQGMANVRVEALNGKPSAAMLRAENESVFPALDNSMPAVAFTEPNNTDALDTLLKQMDFVAQNKAQEAKPNIALMPPTAVVEKAMTKVTNAAPLIQQPMFLEMKTFVGASDATMFVLQAAEKMGAAGLHYPLSVEASPEGYQVRVGPFKDVQQMEELKQRLLAQKVI